MIQGVRIARGAPIVTHLFFVDDSPVFIKATAEERNLKTCLMHYERALGQLINYDKSAITFSRTSSHCSRHVIQNTLGLQDTQGHDMYLGSPTFTL